MVFCPPFQSLTWRSLLHLQGERDERGLAVQTSTLSHIQSIILFEARERQLLCYNKTISLLHQRGASEASQQREQEVLQ